MILLNWLSAQVRSFKTKLWKFETNDKLFTSPLVYEQVLYFGCKDSSFYTVEEKEGKLSWHFEKGGAVLHPLQ